MATGRNESLREPTTAKNFRAAEVNRRLDRARATAKSVRWRTCRMRKGGQEAPLRTRWCRRPEAVS